jgi:chorismate-pyruvate lyase
VVQLASLTVTPGTLQPAFTGGTTQYTVDLTSDVTSVRVTAQPAVAGDTVTINGQATTSSDIPLGAAGTTTPVSIVVSESGTNSRTYIVLLVRTGLTGNNSLQNLIVSSGTLTPAFNANTTNYTVDVASSATSVTVTPTLSDPAATMTVNGQVTSSGQGRSIMLNGVGSNTAINIVVTAPNGNSKPYTIIVERAPLGGNNNLQSLTVSPGALAPTFNPNTLTYSVDVEDDVTSVTISATKSDPNAVMSGSVQAGAGTATGQATISLGGPGTSKTVSITVTAPNQSSKTYTVTVERAAQAGNNNLQSLVVSPGSLTPAFTATRQRYTVNVESKVTSVTVTATLQDTNASMEVNGQGTSSGQAREIFLRDEGSSTNITIRVNPPNGNAKTYRVTVNRASNGDNGDDEDEEGDD